MTTVLLWDVDGTLLTTGRAGLFAFEAALRELFGVEADLSALATSGLTDAQVSEVVLEAAGIEPTPDRAEALLRAYERHLPEKLPLRHGEVMPGVREVLEELAEIREVVSLLLTGNTSAGAAAKLAHYGLDRFFNGAGAFCAGAGGREEIARRALMIAAERLGGDPDLERVYVIGDSPSDVRCGRAIGARTVAVASGWHSLEELAECGPWLLLERIPEPGRFRSLLGIDGR